MTGLYSDGLCSYGILVMAYIQPDGRACRSHGLCSAERNATEDEFSAAALACTGGNADDNGGTGLGAFARMSYMWS